MKKTISLILAFALIFSLTAGFASAAKVVLSPQLLNVNGRPVNCEKYNIDGSNYFKLRDIAYLLSGTESQFSVGWDASTKSVSIVTGEPYTADGSELNLSGGDKSSTAVVSKQTILINGVVRSNLSVYNIGGNNYFKLRDLGVSLGFQVDYDARTNTAIIRSGAGTDDPALSAEQVFAKCSPAVFYIEVYNAEGRAVSSGSGFFVDGNGTAVTNYHVIDDAVSAKITVSDTQKTYDIAGVYAYDEDEDWALIKIDGSGFSYLSVGTPGTAVGGATVFAIGSPLGLQNTISQGIISNPARVDGGISYIQTTAAISSGSSGGALINKYGEVIGITSASYIYGQNLNLAIPMSYVDLSAVNNPLTKLSTLSGSPSASARLKRFLINEGYNYTQFEESGYEIGMSDSGSYGEADVWIGYYPEDDILGAYLYFETSSDSFMYMEIDLCGINPPEINLYFASAESIEDGESFDGFAFINPSTFSAASSIKFIEYDNSSEAADAEWEAVAVMTADALLTAAGDLLESYGAPVTMRELGFLNY